MGKLKRPSRQIDRDAMTVVWEWAVYVMRQWEQALASYEASGLKPTNKMIAASIEHYRGAVSGLKYFMWIMDPSKPQRKPSKGKGKDGVD